MLGTRNTSMSKIQLSALRAHNGEINRQADNYKTMLSAKPEKILQKY